jgi:hypothetical protein
LASSGLLGSRDSLSDFTVSRAVREIIGAIIDVVDLKGDYFDESLVIKNRPKCRRQGYDFLPV